MLCWDEQMVPAKKASFAVASAIVEPDVSRELRPKGLADVLQRPIRFVNQGEAAARNTRKLVQFNQGWIRASNVTSYFSIPS